LVKRHHLIFACKMPSSKCFAIRSRAQLEAKEEGCPSFQRTPAPRRFDLILLWDQSISETCSGRGSNQPHQSTGTQGSKPSLFQDLMLDRTCSDQVVVQLQAPQLLQVFRTQLESQCTTPKATGLLSCLQMKIASFRMKPK